MFEVRKRGGFSDRNGIKNENIVMQFTDLDERTRNRLIATVTDIYRKVYAHIPYSYQHDFEHPGSHKSHKLLHTTYRNKYDGSYRDI